jgi:hypothetical protein
LYDLLWFGFGQRGLVEWSDEVERDAREESGWYDTSVWPCGAKGDATRELDGMLAGVMEFGLYNCVGEIQQYGLAGWLLDALVISWEACRGEATALQSE